MPSPIVVRPIRTAAIVAAVSLALAPATLHAGGLVNPFLPTPWFVGGTQVNGDFGFSAATAGDVDGDGYGDVIVGAPLEDGALGGEGGAYLFRGSPQGSQLTHSWLYRAAQLNASTGTSVASAGDVNNDGYMDVIVGVPAWDTSGPTVADVGKVAVFHGGPSGLPLTPTYELFPPTPAANLQFGNTVAPAGDTNGDGYADVLVGAVVFEGGLFRGGAFLFEGGVGGLFATPAQTWLGTAGMNSGLGSGLASAGDVNADGFADVIIGAPGEASPSSAGGNAYVYLGAATGVPATPVTVIHGPANDARLGTSVSGAGDVNGDGYADILVGVPGLNGSAGEAWLGLGTPSGIPTVSPLPNPEALPNESIGSVVATLGDINGDGLGDFGVVASHTSGGNHGRVSVFRGTRTGPEYIGDLLPPAIDGFFGNSLGSSGDANGDGFTEILVGSEAVSVQPGQHEGFAYQFKAPRNGLRLATGGWPRSGAQAATGYGSAVAIVPRFDGADPAKLVIGDPQFNGVGRISVHSGSSFTGVNFGEERSVLGSGTFLSFGTRIVDAGDTDGDGYMDFAVSSTTADNGPASQAGRVELHRGALGLPPVPVPIVSGASSSDRVGSALAGRGDVNGDGFHDLLVGAREWDEPGKADCGKAFLFFGSETGLLTAPPWTRVGAVAGQGLGASVALTDYDGDGYTDVIVGSSAPVQTAPGKVEVFYGGPGGPASTPGVTYVAPVPEVSFGLTVAGIGDVTADGIADLGIGAPRENNRGVVRIYGGTRGRSQSPIPLAVIPGTQDDARFGEAMAGGGDVDGDGIGDLAIGEPGWDGGQAEEGRFGLYHGAPIVPQAVPAIVVESNIAAAALGASFAPFRDINLDGFADVVVGAPGGAGRVYPFAGGGAFGMRHALDPVDYAGGGERTVHPAISHDPDQVATYFFMHTAAQGRTRLGFEIEIKPHNEPFDGVVTNLSGSTAFNSGPAGTTNFVFATSFLSPELPGRGLRVRGRWTTPNPLFPRTRWITPEAHTSGDHDVWITGAVVGVPGDGPGAAGPLRIESVSPNPAGASEASRIAFTLPQAGRVTVDVFDVRGSRVRRVLDEVRPAGRSSAAWDGRDETGRRVAAGVYLLSVRHTSGEVRGKIALLR